MSVRDPDVDPLPIASLSAALGGAASIWQPAYLGLALAGASLAAALWLPRVLRGRPRGIGSTRVPLLGAIALAASGGAFLGASGPWAPVRGPALGAVALGLWLSVRGQRSSPGEGA